MKKVRMMLVAAVSMLLIAATGYAAPAAPVMTLAPQGQSLSISWTPSQGATGYTLAYAQYPWQPWMTMDDIHYADMGTATNISFLLWEGAAYYVAVQAYDGQGSSEFSNIDYFVMGPPTPTWVDDDGDGFREVDGDCNDTNIYVYPRAIDACGDGIDADCNGIDPICNPNDIDNDGDGLSESQGDCDDANIYIYLGAIDICGDGYDADCNGVDPVCDLSNIDNDGDGLTENQGDCNDTTGVVRPGAPEICGDGIDQDCSGSDLSCNSAENLNGVWHDNGCIDTVTDVDGYVFGGSSKEIIIVNGNTLTAQDITYYGSNCTGGVFDTYTYVYNLTFVGLTTTTNGELCQKILMKNVDVYWVNYNSYQIMEFSDNYEEFCDFIPSTGQEVHENQCNMPVEERFLGTVLYGIYKIADNKLYINDDIDNYPTYLSKSYPYYRQ